MTDHAQPAHVAGTPSACLERLMRKSKFTTVEAAEYLREVHEIRISVSTLNSDRCRGGGPAFYKFRGRHVFYMKPDLDAWATEQNGPRFTSTSAAA